MDDTYLDRSLANSMALGIFLRLIFIICPAIGVWGLALKINLLWSFLAGLIIGLAIGLINAKLILRQQTKEKAESVMYGMGSLFGAPFSVLGVLGLAVWIIRAILF